MQKRFLVVREDVMEQPTQLIDCQLLNDSAHFAFKLLVELPIGFGVRSLYQVLMLPFLGTQVHSPQFGLRSVFQEYLATDVVIVGLEPRSHFLRVEETGSGTSGVE